MRKFSVLVLPLTAAFTLILCCCAAFVGLTESSFWVDELFTAYFADPMQATLLDVFLRAAEDVHPPGYYLLVWGVARGTGLEFVLASRGISAVLAVLALGLVALAPTRLVTTTPRVLAAAFAASSYMWFEYSQEARSYALCFVLVAGLMCFALRCIAPLQSGRVPAGLLAGVVMISLLAALSHYYAVLLSGAVFSMLLCFCRSWRAFLTVSLSGLFVLAVVGVFVSWHMPQIVADSSKTWFSSDASFIFRQIIRGFREALGGIWLGIFVLLLLVLTLVTSALRPVQQSWVLLKDNTFWMPVAFLAGVFILTIAYGLAVTIWFVPMFSFRVFNLLVTVAWIGLAYVIHFFLCQTPPGRLRLSASLLLAPALLAAMVATVQNRGALDSQAWRQSAQFISELEGCSTAILPVIWWNQPYTSDDSPEWFYGYYLPAAPERGWITIPQDEALVGMTSEQMGALVAATATGVRSCPVVLWSVHMHGPSIEQMQEALQAHIPENAQVSVKAQIILPPQAEPWEHAQVFLLKATN